MNRESLEMYSFDGELLGNCDEVVRYLCHCLNWTDFENCQKLEEISLAELRQQAQERLDDRHQIGVLKRELESNNLEPPSKISKIALSEDKNKLTPVGQENPVEPEMVTNDLKSNESGDNVETSALSELKEPVSSGEQPVDMASFWQSRWKPKLIVKEGQFCKLDSKYQTVFFGSQLDLEEEEESETEETAERIENSDPIKCNLVEKSGTNSDQKDNMSLENVLDCPASKNDVPSNQTVDDVISSALTEFMKPDESNST